MKKWVAIAAVALLVCVGALGVPKIRRTIRKAIRTNPLYLKFRGYKFPRRGPAGPVPRTRDGRPDLSGVWEAPFKLPNEDDPPLTPDARATLQRRREIMDQGFHYFCRPPGPLLMESDSHELVVGANQVAEISEYPGVRVIRMDGKGHRASPEPSFNGDEIAWWDGDTLVVDSIGFNDQTWLTRDGAPHSTRLHLIQR